jgi:hypothetical protein
MAMRVLGVFLLAALPAHAQMMEFGGGYKHSGMWEGYFGLSPTYSTMELFEPMVYFGNGFSVGNRLNLHRRCPFCESHLPYATVAYGTRGFRFDVGTRVILPWRRSSDAAFVLDVKYLYSNSHSFVVSFGLLGIG